MGTYIGTCVENFRLISTLRDKSYFSMTAIQLNAAAATFSAVCSAMPHIYNCIL
jgi:hypothetical protein